MTPKEWAAEARRRAEDADAMDWPGPIVEQVITSAIEEDRHRMARCNTGHETPAHLWDCPHPDHLAERMGKAVPIPAEGAARIGRAPSPRATSRPSYNHSRGDSPAIPCSECAPSMSKEKQDAGSPHRPMWRGGPDVRDGEREVTINESEWMLDARKAIVALAQKGDADLAERLHALGWMHRDDGLEGALVLVRAEIESLAHVVEPCACVAQGKLEVARDAIAAALDMLK